MGRTRPLVGRWSGRNGRIAHFCSVITVYYYYTQFRERTTVAKMSDAHRRWKEGVMQPQAGIHRPPPSATDSTEPSVPAISVIIPTLNEETAIGTTLDALARLCSPIEVLVVDG